MGTTVNGLEQDLVGSVEMQVGDVDLISSDGSVSIAAVGSDQIDLKAVGGSSSSALKLLNGTDLVLEYGTTPKSVETKSDGGATGVIGATATVFDYRTLAASPTNNEVRVDVWNSTDDSPAIRLIGEDSDSIVQILDNGGLAAVRADGSEWGSGILSLQGDDGGGGFPTLRIHGNDNEITTVLGVGGNRALAPDADGTTKLGLSARKWSEAHVATYKGTTIEVPTIAPTADQTITIPDKGAAATNSLIVESNQINDAAAKLFTFRTNVSQTTTATKWGEFLNGATEVMSFQRIGTEDTVELSGGAKFNSAAAISFTKPLNASGQVNTFGDDTVSRLDNGGDHTFQFKDKVADGASAVAFEFDTTNSLATSGAKLLSFKNATVEKFAIDKDGGVATNALNPTAAFNLNGFAGTNVNIISSGAGKSVKLQNIGADAAGTVACIIETTTMQTTATDNMFIVKNGATTLINAGKLAGFNGVTVGGVFTFSGSDYSPSGVAEFAGFVADGTATHFLGNNTTVPCKLGTQRNDGATAVGFLLETAKTFSTSGAVHTQWFNLATKLMELEAVGGILKIAPSTGRLWINGLQVVGTRKTGWAAATGTATRTTFVTSTVTLPQLAERVKALLDDLHATSGHGLIGT